MRAACALGLAVLGAGCSQILGIGGVHATDGDAATADAPADATSGADAPGSADGALDAAGLRVQDVQNDAMAVGTAIRLEGVIVTAVDHYGAKTGAFWIADPAGGPFSGVEVFGAQTADVDSLGLGDVITIDNAQKTEFALSSDTSGRTTTEVEPITGMTMTVQKTGVGTVPAPAVVDPTLMAAVPAEAEKWEGVLVEVDNVRLGNTLVMANGGDPTNLDAPITGPLIVFSSMTKIDPATYPREYCFTKLTGIVDYFFTYNLLPRTASDLGSAGVGCLGAESGAALCANGLDDDHDGLVDCLDPSCGC